MLGLIGYIIGWLVESVNCEIVPQEDNLSHHFDDYQSFVLVYKCQ